MNDIYYEIGKLDGQIELAKIKFKNFKNAAERLGNRLESIGRSPERLALETLVNALHEAQLKRGWR